MKLCLRGNDVCADDCCTNATRLAIEPSMAQRDELLAALRIAEDALGSDNPDIYLPALDAVTAVLAKAEGRS
jgi:hypothetical protein